MPAFAAAANLFALAAMTTPEDLIRDLRGGEINLQRLMP